MRTFTLRRVSCLAVAIACSGSDTDAATDSAAAPDTASTAAASTSEPTGVTNTPGSLTAEDINRWELGMMAELTAVKKAGEQLKAAKNINDSSAAILAANDMSTRDAGAAAAGVDGDRYHFIRSTLSAVAGSMSPIEQEMDVSKLPAAAVAELKKGREAEVTRATAELSPQLVEALRPRAAALRKQDLELTAERLRAAGMAR